MRDDAEIVKLYAENVGRMPVNLYPSDHPQWGYTGRKPAGRPRPDAVALAETATAAPVALRKIEWGPLLGCWAGMSARDAAYESERLLVKLTCKHESISVYAVRSERWTRRGPRGGRPRRFRSYGPPDTCSCPDCYQDISVRDLPIEAFSYWHDGNYTMTFDPCAHETVNVFTGCCASCGENVRRMVAA